MNEWLSPQTPLRPEMLVTAFGFELLAWSLRYLVLGGGAFLIFWKWKKHRFQNRRIQERFPPRKAIQTEMRYSASTLVIFAVVGALVFWMRKSGLTRMYSDIAEHGWLYFALSIPLMIVIHDFYFYVGHRWMHRPAVFKRVHRVHHLSTNPSPMASYSFHPTEAVIEAGIFPLLIVLMPVHDLAAVIFVFFTAVMNVLGHLGYEIYPEHFVRSPWLGWNNTSTHHNMHHRHFNCNYGLYFNWWDRIFGTNHPEYRSRYEGLFESARYRQNPGSSGMQRSTPATQSTPPERMDKELDETLATQPARALPSNGPLM